MDKLILEKRSWNMSRINGKDISYGLQHLKGAA